MLCTIKNLYQSPIKSLPIQSVYEFLKLLFAARNLTGFSRHLSLEYHISAVESNLTFKAQSFTVKLYPTY